MKQGGYIFVGMEAAGYACLATLLKSATPPDAVFTIHEKNRSRVIAFRSFNDLENGHTPFYYIDSLNELDVVTAIRALAPRLIVTAYWSELISADILSIPVLGCIGLHGTKLPKHRGKAPIPWSLLFGLRQGGMTLFCLDRLPDSGAILAQAEYPIGPDDYAGTIYERAASCAEALLSDIVPRLLAGETLPRLEQQPRLDYWRKREPDDGFIDWWMAADRIYDLVRALSHPFPGAYAIINGERIIIWRAMAFPESYFGLTPGANVLGMDGRLIVATGSGKLFIDEMTWKGRQLSGAEFKNTFGDSCFYT